MELSRLTKLPLRTIWNHEAHDFTIWLSQEDNLTLLGEELDITFVTAQTEVSVGDFHVDILAEDSNEKKVVIENQLEATNHDHLGKLITYASGLGASTVIWIVSRAREEHEQAINWLNDHTTDDANFFLIEIELWQIGDSEPAPKFNIVAKPNDWAKAARQSGTGKISDLKLAQQQFFDDLKEYALNQKGGHIKSWQKAQPQHWYDIRLGSAKAKISASLNTREQDVTVEVYIFEDKDLFHKLLSNKDVIEKAIGMQLDWREMPDKKSSRILAHLHRSNFQDSNQREDIIKWLYETAQKFSKTFSHYINSRT